MPTALDCIGCQCNRCRMLLGTGKLVPPQMCPCQKCNERAIKGPTSWLCCLCKHEITIQWCIKEPGSNYCMEHPTHHFQCARCVKLPCEKCPKPAELKYDWGSPEPEEDEEYYENGEDKDGGESSSDEDKRQKRKAAKAQMSALSSVLEKTRIGSKRKFSKQPKGGPKLKRNR